MRSRDEVADAIDELETARYSVETQARIETLYWVLEVIDAEHCPPGAADDDRLRELRKDPDTPEP